MKAKYWSAGFLLLFLGNAIANAILLIVPSVSTLTTRSDGETSVHYTVTNNATATISTLSIDPYYTSSAASGTLTLQNDTCTGTNLSPGSSCAFGVVISGANQPGQFILTPKVCGNHRLVCSTAGVVNQLTVHDNVISGPAYAYFESTSIISTDKKNVGVPVTNSLVPFNTTDNTAGTALTNLHLAFTGVGAMDADKLGTPAVHGALAVSPDGKTVYAMETSGISSETGGSVGVAVIQGGADPILVQRIALPGATSTDAIVSIVVSPDGGTLYVSDSNTDDSGNGALYAVNLSTDVVTVIADSLSFTPVSLAISPDGSRLYLVNELGGSDFQGSVAIYNTQNNQLIETLDDTSDVGTFYTPTHVAVNSDDTTLYVMNAGLSNIMSINIANGAYTRGTSVSVTAPMDFTLSSNGNNLYVSNSFDSDIAVIDTASMSVSSTIPTSADANSGLALTPNNSTLYVAPFGSSDAHVISNLAGLPNVSPLIMSGIAITQTGAFVN